jgi:predicted ArsR family transcriptional regulator
MPAPLTEATRALYRVLLDTADKTTVPELASRAGIGPNHARALLKALLREQLAYRASPRQAEGDRPWVFWLSPTGRRALAALLD